MSVEGLGRVVMVVPTYNESENIEWIERNREFLEAIEAADKPKSPKKEDIDSFKLQ